MVVAKDTEARKNNRWVVGLDFTILMVETESAFRCEVQVLYLLLGIDYTCTFQVPRIPSRKHVYNDFIDESSVTRVEKMPKILLKLVKNLINQLCLHLWRKLLVERELLNDKIMIVPERFFDRLIDTEVELSRNVDTVEARFCLLNL